MKVRKLLPSLLWGWLPGGTRQCPLCRHRIWKYLPYRDGRLPALMQALAMVGSDVRNFECPRCGGHDRERHLFLYLQASGLLAQLGQWRILHFAPEARLQGVISAASPREYLMCDLLPQRSGIIRVDIEAIPHDDACFDLVIANHVLEHVADDLQAIREVTRVIRPGGYAILQTPFSAVLERTWDDGGIVSPESRREAYGQEDHVRLYGRDIFERIGRGGLLRRVASHRELLADVDPAVVGVNQAEPFFLYQKPM